MKSVVIACVLAMSLPTSAYCEVQQLSQAGWWAAYGGINDQGAFTCAMVTSRADGGDGKLVIERSHGQSVFVIRILKSSWTISPEAHKNVVLQFGYGPIWRLSAIGTGKELRAELPFSDLSSFMRGFQGAGRIQLTFLGGTEPSWQFATGGGGIVEPDFIKCIRMDFPVTRAPATQP